MRKLTLLTLLLTLSISVAAKPKYGVIKIVTTPSNMPIKVDGQSAGVTTTEVREFELIPGTHVVEISLPDGQAWSKEFEVAAKKTCVFTLGWTPPKEVVVVKKEVETIKEPCPPVESKPPVPEVFKFDDCCDCKKDDLKARLDILSIELQRDPTNTARIDTSDAWPGKYLIEQRGIDPKRVNVFTNPGMRCVVLWVVPRGVR
jgi:hypothetical protein